MVLDDLSDHLNLLKINCVPVTENPVVTVRDIIGYEFINENLLRQAFTRRAFAVEYGLSGCNKELEFCVQSKKEGGLYDIGSYLPRCQHL